MVAFSSVKVAQSPMAEESEPTDKRVTRRRAQEEEELAHCACENSGGWA